MKKAQKGRKLATPKPAPLKAAPAKPARAKPVPLKAAPAKPAPTKPAKPEASAYELRLYVAGQTVNAVQAFANLREICETHLKGRYRIEVIDLLEQPQLARGDQILAIPTVVRRLPAPVRKIIGDLSNTMRVLVGLNLRPGDQPG